MEVKVEQTVYEKGLAIFKSVLIVGWYLISAQLVYFIVGKIEGVKIDDMHYIQMHRYALALASQAVFLLGVLFLTKKNSDVHNPHKRMLSFQKILQYVLIGVGAFFTCAMINLLLAPIFPGYKQIENLFTDREPLERFLTFVIGAPIVEEYLFRNKIQGYLKKGFSLDIAIIVQAVLFGVLHQVPLQKVYAMVMGILFGIIKENEKSFASTVIIHMTVNLIGWAVGTFVVLM